MKKSDFIYFIEKNIHGAFTVYGVNGIKQYYYYTKKQAETLYINECKKTMFFAD